MRILVVSQYFWPESFRINELIDALPAAGCEVTVLTGQPNYPEGKIFEGYKALSFRKEVHNGYSIIRVPMMQRNKAKAYQLILNYLSFVISTSFFAPWLLRGERFDVIFVYAPSPILQVIPAIILKKIKRVPLVTWVGDLWPQSLVSTGFVANRFLLKIIEQFVRFIYRQNDLLLVQSRPFIGPVKKLAGAVPVEYFPNPGEAMFADKSSMLATPVYKLKKGFNIVFAGNLGSVQAIEMIFKAAMILQEEPDINIFLFGNGSMTEWLKTEISAKELKNLVLAGRFPTSAMPAIFAQADVLLVSLIKDETMSLTVPAKVQTYMAAGKPIIAALDGEGAKIVTDAGAGVATPAEDAVALANVILALSRLPQSDLTKMGDAGYLYYKKNFDSGMLTDRFIKRLSTIIKI